MAYIYRGVKYTPIRPASPQELALLGRTNTDILSTSGSSQYTCTYRGVAYPVFNYGHFPSGLYRFNLKFRGVSYQLVY
uniref:DUF4278 domain-containing protein n=1 Tax=Cyanothece sp. (strain PCC 7425 / ATCC 29141) TaxID=395961 RepID=B8HQY0_CYAP4